MKARTIGGILVLVLLIGVLLYTRTQATDDTNKVAKALGMSLLTHVEGYEANKEYLDLQADLAHDAAFEKSFETGARRENETFRQEVFTAEFLEHLINQVRNDGRQDLTKAIEELRERMQHPKAG